MIAVACLSGASVYAQLDLHGFADARMGARTGSDPAQDDYSLMEFRLQLDREIFLDRATIQLRSDFVYDDLAPTQGLDLETGEGWLDPREVNLQFSPTDIIDVKAGRQILTWGTGDLLFINDLFPKDWVSFFTGRDEEYLKAPSDAVLISGFPSWININVVYVPRFDADRFITGERISFYQPQGPGVISADVPDRWLDDDEWAVRLSRNVGGYELALYGYEGFWKSPAGQDAASGAVLFPPLRTLGASARGTLGAGIAHAELGYYDSLDDDKGSDPFVRNSETRALVGYEREVARELTLGVQYYVEVMDDYTAYQATLPEGAVASEQDRHVVTLRLTQQLLDQNLVASFVTLWSPSDEDGYLRPNLAYKLTDDWLMTVGGNLWFGAEDHTFFGQFEQNNNVYGGVRYSF
jgi:hypothetical protein